jgi:hypothetical protein
MSIAGVRNSARRESAQRAARRERDAADAVHNPSPWDVCACEHYRAEHTGPTGHCEVIIVHAGRERDCVCREFRFMRRRRA